MICILDKLFIGGYNSCQERIIMADQFENFIMQCCEMDEWDLRIMLKEKLSEAGFNIQEDNYSSYRGGRYQEVHNMLAMRGEKPRICLVAHTDTVRDMSSRGGHRKTTPTIKTINHYGNMERIIQDKDCRVQVAGDDRLGVAINTWIALNAGYDMGLLFSTDEESGNQSADYANFPELKNFELCMQVDRGNRVPQLVVKIGYTQLCSNEVTNRLLCIAEKIGLPRDPVNGLMTDVLSLKSAGKIKNAVNMTCGYHNNHQSSEYIVIREADETLQFVSSVIKDYEMETIDEMENKETINFIPNELEIVAEYCGVIWN